MHKVLLLLALVGCARLQITPAIPTWDWTEATSDTLDKVVARADGYVVGTVEKVKEVWLYDDICSGLASVFGVCGGTEAYRLSIRAAEPVQVYVFVPRGDTLPLPVGTRAVFIWKMAWVRRLLDCAQRVRTGVTNVCESDWLPVVVSRDNVIAPKDSATVAWLFTRKQ